LPKGRLALGPVGEDAHRTAAGTAALLLPLGAKFEAGGVIGRDPEPDLKEALALRP